MSKKRETEIAFSESFAEINAERFNELIINLIYFRTAARSATIMYHKFSMKNIFVDGANGGLHTNYEGKAAAAVRTLLEQGDDFVYIHVEAPDEMGHQGSPISSGAST